MIKKIETKLKHDKARNEHIEEIEKLEKSLTFIPFNSKEYFQVVNKLILYITQLRLYDEVMYGQS